MDPVASTPYRQLLALGKTGLFLPRWSSYGISLATNSSVLNTGFKLSTVLCTWVISGESYRGLEAEAVLLKRPWC